jgi:SAM-dependent methyltransferase
MSTVFTWKESDAYALLSTCERDDVTGLIKKYVRQGSSILEAGCGSGRYVKYLANQGYAVEGVELSAETVGMVKRIWPDCAVVQGDVLDLPYPSDSFDAVLSLGVVEHFPAGPGPALREIRRVLRPGGVAIMTVPCLNTVRRIKRSLWLPEVLGLRRLAAAFVKGESLRPNRTRQGHLFAVYPAFGRFFEYRMTPDEFTVQVEKSGMVIVEHCPSAVMDGLYHDLNPGGLLIKFSDWRFQPTPFATWLNSLLSRRPFSHCHMQAIVAHKPDGTNSLGHGQAG